MTIPTKYEKYAFLIVFGIVLYLSFLLLKGYLTAIFFGGVIAYSLYPLHNKIRKRVKKESHSAFLVSLIAFLVVASVVAISVPQVVNEVRKVQSFSQDVLEDQRERIKGCDTKGSLYCTIVTPYRSTIEGNETNGTSNIVKITSGILASTQVSLGSIFTLFIKLIVMGFAIFYFLENGQVLIKRFLHLLPMHQRHEDVLEKRVKDTLDAVIRGSVITSILQGSLGGIMFWILGISSPFLWGLLMTVLAFIPTAGAALVWFPAAIILMLTGHVVKGVILFAFGFAVLGYIDNILKPKIIGNKIQISSFMMFLSVIGGLGVFGIAGLFLGPLIISLTIVLIDFLEEVMHG